MSGETIFDKIIQKKIPSKVVYEDEDVFAFHDVNPQAPVHVLVIPKKKSEKFSGIESIEDLDVAKLFKGAAKVARLLKLNDDGYRIVINNGKHGQQTVDYLHLHILGGRQMNWPPG